MKAMKKRTQLIYLNKEKEISTENNEEELKKDKLKKK